MVIKPSRGDDHKDRELPEFIFVDNGDEDKTIHYHPEEEERYSQPVFQKLETMKFPFALRMLALFAATIVLILIGFALLSLVLVFCFALITLFQSQEINRQVRVVWAQCKKLLVICLGLIIAVFSPPLGLGLIVLDAMFHGQKISDSLMSRFMK